MLSSRSAKVSLLLGVALLPLAAASAQTSAGSAPKADTRQPQQSQSAGTSGAEQPATAAAADLDEIVVTGLTTRNRRLITSSADITFANAADIERKAPRSVADLLELVPGIFVEATAGEVSNNYSVRGLLGGGQRFVQLEEDGLPIVYGGGGADEFFSNDITIDRLEAVKGGSSGVLSVNGAGATINFISKLPNFDKPEGIARFTAYSYGSKRGDFYYSAPLNNKLAFNVGGFFRSSPGVRNNPFQYDAWQVKAALEYKADDGGFVRVTGKIGDRKDAYYADQPYRYTNGQPGSILGLDAQFDNIGGTAFGKIEIPVSTFVEADGFRAFRLSRGIEAKTKQIRIDIDKPLGDSFDLFLKARYLDLKWDFNGLFPGSGTGNAGLASAVAYLTPGAGGPFDGFLAQGAAAFPGTTRFGIKDLTTGQILSTANPGALNALNGNGFLQQTTLNHDYERGTDFGSNFGGRWEYKGNGFTNSLTVGVMVYDVSRKVNQSATAAVVNDVRNDSHIYDVVALGATGNVLGTLTDNGLISYGNWGAGIRQRDDTSVSVYANDEFSIGKLHVDAGVRYESVDSTARDGRNASAADPANRIVQVGPGQFEQLVPVGTAGITRTVGSTFDGTFDTRQKTQGKVAYTIGANYLIRDNLSVYGRYAIGFQSNNTDPFTEIELYEAGVRFQSRYLVASATFFRTNFNKQFYNFIDPVNPTLQTSFLADLSTDGVEIDANIRPTDWFAIDFAGVFQNPKLQNLTLGGVPQPKFAGNRPERTPAQLFTITPTIKLPNGLGEVYARYKYIGKIFADSGNGVALPAYGVTSVGINVNINDRLQASVNADNIFNVIGLTEGNPRQGQTQNASSGYFYARGIVGPTYGGSITFRF